jgi:hypothetical protein
MFASILTRKELTQSGKAQVGTGLAGVPKVSGSRGSLKVKMAKIIPPMLLQCSSNGRRLMVGSGLPHHLPTAVYRNTFV